MAAKPTYEELEQRIKDLENESASRIRMEEVLQESGRMFRVAFDQAPVGMCLVSPDGRFLNVNDGICDMLGYTESELLSRTFQDITHPDDLVSSKEWVRKLLLGETTTTDLNKRYVHRKGHIVRGTVRAFLLRNSDGSPRFFITHVQDVTEHKRAEEEKERLQTQLANAVEMARLAPWEYDVVTDLFTFNDHFYKIFRTTGKEVGGYQMSSAEYARRFVHPDDISVVAKEIKKSIEVTDPKFSQNLEHRMMCADGTVGYISVRISIVKDDQGKTIRTYGVNQDITERKKSEEALLASEKRFRALYQGSPTPTVTWQKQGNDFVLVDFNHAAKVITGGKVQELLGRKASELYSTKQEALNGLFRCHDEEKITRTETTSELFLPGRLVVFTSAFVPPDLVLVHLEDITERRKAEEALKESEESYRSLYDEAPVGYVEIDREGCVARVNKRQSEMLGYTAEELLGQPLWHLVVEEGAKEAIKAKLAGTLPPSKGFERTYRRKDGTTISVLIDDMIVRDKDGRIIANRSTFQDITERKRAEEALRESEERYRDLYDKAPVGYHEMDNQGRITRINRQESLMLGYSAEEMLGQPIWNFIVENEAREAERFIKAKFDGLMPPSKGLDRTYRRKDGTLVSVIIDDHFVTDGNGRISGIRTTVRDNTERKRAEKEKEKLQSQLIQAQKMESIGTLAGGIAHDFNNMLGIIIGNVDLAALQVDPADPVHKRLQEILKASRRSAETVKQLLAFARRQTISPKVLDLNETVSGMLNMLQPLIGENIDLNWKPGHGLSPVKIDPSQISQILANLAVNARDAIVGVGKITIETENVELNETYCASHKGFRQGKYTMLAVSDTGTGMPKEVLAHLFEPFFTTKDVGKGTGLGLSTVYGIMKQNNGFINVYSELGQGTTLKVYLPSVEAKSPGKRVESMPEKLPRGTETVLVVEDEEAILSVGKAMLEKLGYKVLTATRPREAIQITEGQEKTIQLLLTDVVMPEMSGRDLADHLKTKYPDLKCLYMSGYTANVIADHGILDEGIAFIQKPFSTKEIAVKVREVLDSL